MTSLIKNFQNQLDEIVQDMKNVFNLVKSIGEICQAARDGHIADKKSLEKVAKKVDEINKISDKFNIWW